jgi:hypothetical protein
MQHSYIEKVDYAGEDTLVHSLMVGREGTLHRYSLLIAYSLGGEGRHPAQVQSINSMLTRWGGKAPCTGTVY